MRTNPYLLLISLCLTASLSYAQEEPEPVKEVHYFDLDPNIITNYQKPPSRRLGFITIDVQFQVSSVANLDALEYHKPLIEDTLIDVINSQDETIIKDIAQRNAIRDKIKQRLSAVLKEETGEPIIEDVLFTKFIYQ